MTHIKVNLGVVDYICISSHEEVREALVDSGLEFTLVYPGIANKKEYLNRYRRRANNSQFINLLSANWNMWISQLMAQKGCKHLVLGPCDFLSNFFDYGDMIEVPNSGWEEA